jgi:hypothetical protein
LIYQRKNQRKKRRGPDLNWEFLAELALKASALPDYATTAQKQTDSRRKLSCL